MPVSISDHIKIDPNIFSETGAFDAVLDVDFKLFIDPHLLEVTSVPELKDSYQDVLKRFEDILVILCVSKYESDVFWREALRKFSLPELRGTCIGYSSRGTSGSGMGLKLRQQLLRTAKEIIDAGTKEPKLFELIGLFEENIGPDRISDMVGRIIVNDLRKYTERIFADLNVPVIKIKNTPYHSIVNPFNRYPVILLPKETLKDLPIAECWEDIDVVCAHNSALRQKVNAVIGGTWKTATSVKKSKLKKIVIGDPEVLHDLFKSYENNPATTYDFESDPAGQVIWLTASRQYVSQFPIELKLPEKPSADDLVKTVLVICEKFKDLVENNALSSLLYDASGDPKKEEAAQKVFYGIADAYCSANNLDLSREANAGRGPVDFKLSKGYDERVVVEAKLTTNKQLIHGFETQIEEYKKAEKTHLGIYLVIDVAGGSSTRVADLKKLIADSKSANLTVP